LPDPAGFWISHGAELAERAARLNRMRLDSVRFKGPGTDFEVGLAELSEWHGGPDTTRDGRVFCPNVPTEEVFTTPDCRRANGRVAFTRPVLVPIVGKIVEGGWLEFKDGKVVDHGARSGKDVLDTYLNIDEGTGSLGELALVDATSPVFLADRIFYNILFDENAACHIALGSAYAKCLRGGESMSEKELSAAGANSSSAHTDFMIGAPNVDVTGMTREGKEVEIISSGRFSF